MHGLASALFTRDAHVQESVSHDYLCLVALHAIDVLTTMMIGDGRHGAHICGALGLIVSAVLCIHAAELEWHGLAPALFTRHADI